MADAAKRSRLGARLYGIGCRISEFRANTARHQTAIVLVACFCAAWFLITRHAGENTLTLPVGARHHPDADGPQPAASQRTRCT